MFDPFAQIRADVLINKEADHELSSFDEGLLDDEVTGLAVIALGKTAPRNIDMQLFQHAGASAQHDAIGLDIEAGKVRCRRTVGSMRSDR